MSLSSAVSDLASRLAHAFRKAAPSEPTLTYTDGVLTRIDYANGDSKVFTYTGGVLTQIDFTVGSTSYRKTFNYTSGVLTSIDETEI